MRGLWAELPFVPAQHSLHLGNCYFPQVINPIIPPPLYSTIPFRRRFRGGRATTHLSSPTEGRERFPLGAFCSWVQWVSKVIHHLWVACPTPFPGPERGWICNCRSAKAAGTSQRYVQATISKLPVPGAGTKQQENIPIQGLKHQGPRHAPIIPWLEGLLGYTPSRKGAFRGKPSWLHMFFSSPHRRSP